MCGRFGKFVWVLVILIGFRPGSSRWEEVVNYHLVDLKSLLGFVSDSVPAVSSDDCATSLQVEFSGRDDIYIDPAAIGVEPACEENPENHRKLLRFDALCEDLKKNLDFYCEMMECEQLRNYIRFNKPFANVGSRFFVLSESNYTHNRSLSVFLIEDTPPGNCEGFLKTIQGGELPRPTNLTKSRTLLSGDLMVVKVMKEDTSDRECLYVAEDRRRNDRYTVSHRVRIEDSEKGEVLGTELKFKEMWAAKLGLWADTIVAEFSEDANARKTFLELRVRKVSYQKAHMIATTVTRSDIIGVVLKVRPSFAQSFSPDCVVWYRVDGGGIVSVAFGGWKKIGSFDPTRVAIPGALAVLIVGVVIALILSRRKRRRTVGYETAPTEDPSEAGSDT
ncbi:hypothetical protein NDN08_004926 [Rhodosorus marinus]|uniref:Uncharacterized protein n=1 Tax=Rhodosorus marinus TaxID=101924 RepID=A0AAV8UHZ8_9RHOD|nr:hypothetical protein NDN08_004926 [Rhodosorus marinus]